MRINPVLFDEQVYNESDECYKKWLYTQPVDFINLEKLLKDEKIIEEIEDINPFSTWDYYRNWNSDDSKRKISSVYVKHNKNIIKGINEKVEKSFFTYAQDYNIKEIKFNSIYPKSIEKYELLSESEELKELLTQFDIEYVKYLNFNKFKKTIKIEDDTKILDIKEAIDNILSLTGFIDNSIKRIEAPDKKIIADEYDIAKNNT
ncbi:MAG: hypothetical protein KAI51_00115 [Candidatus Aenigmarchaeota archaeon]|nr:hypothetical protein [Candidatus Aenigmarchaeota archaeon]MCK5451821.1 hypothetical protein [Candidatus Aenigmarchaeota archaeon]